MRREMIKVKMKMVSGLSDMQSPGPRVYILQVIGSYCLLSRRNLE